MRKSLIKKLFKWLVPAPEELASIAAEAIADKVNSSDKQALIAKGSTLCLKATRVQEIVAKWLADGKVDEVEKAELKDSLVPIFSKLKESL